MKGHLDRTSEVWYSLLWPSGTSIIPFSLSHVIVDNVKASLLLFNDASVKLSMILSGFWIAKKSRFWLAQNLSLVFAYHMDNYEWGRENELENDNFLCRIQVPKNNYVMKTYYVIRW